MGKLCILWILLEIIMVSGSDHFTTLVLKPLLAEDAVKSDNYKLVGSVLERFRRDVIEPTTTPVTSNIRSMNIVSRVTSRFMNTQITSVIENIASNATELKFKIQIPQSAFISNFTMLINGTLLVAEVMEKEAAQKIYDEAKKSGATAGQVASDSKAETPERAFELFAVSVNVAALSSATFEISYQELLIREFGLYNVHLSVRPNQIVPDLKVDVYIHEPEGIESINAAAPVGGTATALIIHEDTTTKHVSYYPSTVEQGQDGGLNGDLLVWYDVAHDNAGGMIHVVGDYFVHFFSPSGLDQLNKNILFIIDISGSMGGGQYSKMEQARDALIVILGQLEENDGFAILLFDDKVVLWNQQIVQATAANINAAKSWARENVVADGSTNINDALITGITIMKSVVSDSVQKAPIIVFLTDGEPTAGVTDTSTIRQNVKDAADGKVSLFSLAFGYGISLEFLQILSYENGGDAQRIYAEADAVSQLDTFYKKISSPSLLNVRVDYLNAVIEAGSVTQNTYPQYFNGTEIVIAGKIQDSASEVLTATVYGNTATNEIDLVAVVVQDTPTASVSGLSDITIQDFTEKLWVYMQIKDLVKLHLIEKNEVEKAKLKSLAINMSLEYNLVTPFTSMVVVQDDPDNMNNNGFDMSGKAASFPGGGYSSGYNIQVSSFLISLSILLVL
ncbi:unnamed protein product [Owenia fusiformis]|uniref:Uncharacterized protein n=1 Tax=Owenia fusiformis TaxID=6347 RepID=A0A8J1U4R0_OWEFU|nr:unnamed protein product [Owenia fusiformis]